MPVLGVCNGFQALVRAGLLPGTGQPTVLTDNTSGAVNTSADDTFTYTLDGGNTVTVTVTVAGVAGPGDWLRGDGGNNSITGTAGVDLFMLHEAVFPLVGIGSVMSKVMGPAQSTPHGTAPTAVDLTGWTKPGFLGQVHSAYRPDGIGRQNLTLDRSADTLSGGEAQRIAARARGAHVVLHPGPAAPERAGERASAERAGAATERAGAPAEARRDQIARAQPERARRSGAPQIDDKRNESDSPPSQRAGRR